MPGIKSGYLSVCVETQRPQDSWTTDRKKYLSLLERNHLAEPDAVIFLLTEAVNKAKQRVLGRYEMFPLNPPQQDFNLLYMPYSAQKESNDLQ